MFPCTKLKVPLFSWSESPFYGTLNKKCCKKWTTSVRGNPNTSVNMAGPCFYSKTLVVHFLTNFITMVMAITAHYNDGNGKWQVVSITKSAWIVTMAITQPPPPPSFLELSAQNPFFFNLMVSEFKLKFTYTSRDARNSFLIDGSFSINCVYRSGNA